MQLEFKEINEINSVKTPFDNIEIAEQSSGGNEEKAGLLKENSGFET